MNIEPIARFHSPFPAKFGIPRQAGLAVSLRGRIEFEPAYRNPDAVRGLEGFSHIWLIWGFSGNMPPQVSVDAPGQAPADKTAFQATVRPPRLGGNERVGVFASRSPFRPNGLGLSCVEIESIEEEPVINVLGADLMDGTPIYDIKPYITYADSRPEARSGFVENSDWRTLQVVFPEDLKNLLSPAQAEALTEVLEQDPRPQYQDNPQKVYGMKFSGYDIRFKVVGDILTVVEVSAG